MIDAIALCAIGFLSKEPIPEMLKELYKENFSCEKFEPLQRELAIEKLENINKYFPADRPLWPLIINPLDRDSGKMATLWMAYGITPGFILPKIPDKSYINNPEQFKQIKILRDTGAIPIATVANTQSSTLNAARYYWCMHGACPAGWYLPDGIKEDFRSASDGLYVSAEHWYKKQNLPLPDRIISFNGKSILPWGQIQPIKILNDVSAKNLSSLYAFTPEFKEKWEYLGVKYQYNKGYLHTSFLGSVILFVGEVSFWLWDRVSLIEFNVFSLINENFSWIAFFVGMVNIVFFIKSSFRKRKRKSTIS